VKVIRGETAKVSTKEEEKEEVPVPKENDASTETDTGASETLEYGPAEKRNNKALIGWIAVGTGAAFLVGGGVAGGLALMRNEKLKDRCDAENVCSKSDKDYAMGRDLMALSSNVALGIGAAAATAGIVLLVLSKKSQETSGDENGETEAEVSVAPMLTPEFSGMSFMGSF
jgi:hypothetical protein